MCNIMDNISANLNPYSGGNIYSPKFLEEYFDFMKTWVLSSNKQNTNIADWRIWLPRAFYLNWSDPPTWQKSMMDPSIWMPIAFFPQEQREHAQRILNIAGDYIAGDKAMGNIIKNNKLNGDIAGENMIKEIEAINDKSK
jgi:hypothetical protein